MSRHYSEPPYVTEDPPEPEPDRCGDCGEPTTGTSICGPCADARFRDTEDDDYYSDLDEETSE